MRVLFLATHAVGHVFPMVPLAWALRGAGHDVLIATGGEALRVERAGLPVVDVSPGVDQRELFARVAPGQPAPPTGARGMSSRKLSDLREVVVRLAIRSEALVDGAIAVGASWRADLIVQSQIQGAGWLVAAKLGVPLVDHGFGLARTAGMGALYREHLAAAFDRHGVDELPRHHVAVDVAPPSMVGGHSDGWPLRYVPYNGNGVLPDWLARADRSAERPLVAITLGSVAWAMNGLRPIKRIVEATRELDAEFVLALGADADLSTLGPLPANVRAVGWVPLNALLPVCAAIVHHGGAGTTLTALDAGVPQLVLPFGADQHINAAAVAGRGLGIVAEEDTVDAALLSRLLGDEALRRAATDVRSELRAMPPPTSLLPRLAELLGTSQMAI
jgi:UDP:flavonoid glycosyltransferase YjiC (YdhE family)